MYAAHRESTARYVDFQSNAHASARARDTRLDTGSRHTPRHGLAVQRLGTGSRRHAASYTPSPTMSLTFTAISWRVGTHSTFLKSATTLMGM